MDSPPRTSQDAPSLSPSSTESELGPYDVLCGRCKESFNHTGNRRFRIIINLNLKRYMDSPSRVDRSDMIISLVRQLREETGVRFLRKRGSTFVELSERQCREKVGHALRDNVHYQNQQQQQQDRAFSTRSAIARKAKMMIKIQNQSPKQKQAGTIPHVPTSIEWDINYTATQLHPNHSQKEQVENGSDDFSLSDESMESILPMCEEYDEWKDRRTI
jgi:hypothetical protein